MAGGKRKTILISEPSAWEVGVFTRLPYLWGILKSYCERHAPDVAYQFQWLEPIFLAGEHGALLESYDGKKIDILGLSCYIWNWELQCQIAHAVKARYPHCLVIAGGPQPDYKDREFFKKHPYIDMIAVYDGEITFTNVLDKVARGDYDFTDVDGLYLPADAGPLHTGATQLPQVFDYSPYIEQSETYEEIARRHGQYIGTMLETNRGCPYKCSFCDWGASALSKLRRFDMERIEAEIDWLGRIGVYALGMADANFGILPRDVEITDIITSTHEKHGHPIYIAYNNAKNNPERSVAIAKKFFASGIHMEYELAIQHTRKEVLDANNRSNISAEKQVEVAKGLMGGIVDVQLILGLPGDTRDHWKDCFADLMEWGLHSYYLVYFYHVLPNAPVAEPEYMEEWEIDTVMRYVFTFSGIKRERAPVDTQTVRNKIIVGSKSFSRDDWVSMIVYATYVKALHNCGLTQLVTKYLRFTHNVPYRELYEGLIEDLCARVEPMKSWYRAIEDHYQAFLAGEDAVDYMDVAEWADYPYQVNPFQWIYVQSCMQLDTFFDAVEAYLVEKYPEATKLASVIEYQKNLIILPSYRKEYGKSFVTDSNWVEYFDTANQLGAYEPMNEPVEESDFTIKVSDQMCTAGTAVYLLDWTSRSKEHAWPLWFDRTVENHACVTRTNFQQLEVVRREPRLIVGL